MIFPNSVSSPPPIPATLPSSIPDASAETGSGLLYHADYDLQPMAVPSLAHYVLVFEGERFHIR